MVVISTKRLVLRRFTIGDGEAMDQIFGDAEVMKFSLGTQGSEWVRAWISGCIDAYEQHPGFGNWAVAEKSSQHILGYAGLTCCKELGESEIELGYRLARRFWGHGYGTEAALAVRDYGFEKLKLPRLVALIEPNNTASIRVAEKLGMRYEKEVMLTAYTHPDHLYSIYSTTRPVAAGGAARQGLQ